MTHGTRRVNRETQIRPHLPSGVIDLHPHLRSCRLRYLGPFAEKRQIRVLMQCNASRSCKRIAVHHDVPRDDDSGSALCPSVIELENLLARCVALDISEVFLHGGFCYSVGYAGAVGQDQAGKNRTLCHV